MEAGAVEGKGIWVIKGKNVTVENIEFSNASAGDRNGAGIRHEGAGLTVRNCYFRDNENGILTNSNPDSEVLIENSEFSANGDGSGQTHNMYIGKIKRFTLRGSYSHHARVGHNVKSRALTSYILYNRIMDEATGTASYAIDLPSGGISYVIGNLIQQGPRSENSGIISYGAEKTLNPVNELYMTNNTVVNDLDKGSFLYINPATQKIKVMNNIFAGPGKLPEGEGISSNLHSDKSDLADPMQYDYHLKFNSAAIGAAVDPGSANGFALQPLYEYTNGAPPLPRARLKSLDVGAFHFRLQSAPQRP
jgi:Right handed beta helix region